MTPVTLITGASSGIGAELARVFAAHGHELVLVARRERELTDLAEEIAGKGAKRPIVLAVDLAERDAVARIVAELKSRDREPAYLINNAGFGLAGPSTVLDRGEQLAMIDVNVRALTELTLTFVESVARHRGGILNVASIVSFMPGPGMAVYYASKAFVLSFSEALHSELSRRGVRVTALCPGPVATGFQSRAGIRAGTGGETTHLGDPGAARGGNRLRRIDARQTRRRCRFRQQDRRILHALFAARPAVADDQGAHAFCFESQRADAIGMPQNAADSTVMLQPILIVLHQEHSTPGRVGNALRQLGYPLDVRRPRFDDPLPETMAEHAAAIIFGGPMSANDDDRFHPPRDRVDRGAAEREQAVSRHLSRRANVRAPSRRQGISPPRGPCRDRLLSDPAYRRRPRRRRAMAGTRLSVASRGFRPAVRRRAVGRGRYVRGAGDPLRTAATRCNFIPTSRTP